MPYPAKTDREKILAAALKQLEEEGLSGLSLRALASSLNLAPNALYRYFADREQLEIALSDASAERLHGVLRRAVGRKEPEEAILSMARVYLKFAREQPRLYETLLLPSCADDNTDRAHHQLWKFFVEQVRLVADKPDVLEAAVALWAFLHGLAGLSAADVFSHGKPASAFHFGLQAWLAQVRRPVQDS